ncbi:hypothetical protein VNO77_21276 [Canavalia gladiata]|uniref:Uncharacterized protein n=1 Tax=Canavalia gladiata TaxID=3824 RepID=A0AAN9LU95_CANGL
MELNGSSSGVRKGAWSKFEDDLLEACVKQYGEGKWHLVPRRAGLNRCRKSCRLRWLNYLRPNIKRGDFSEDEVDLMSRLHKLLGNRWSLIAGRLPGRTANDVKNYWNTYKRGKVESEKKVKPEAVMERVKRHEVIKPVPRTFMKVETVPCRLQGKLIGSDEIDNGEASWASLIGSTNWWETVLDDIGDNTDNNNTNTSSLAAETVPGEEDGTLITHLWDHQFITSLTPQDSHFLPVLNFSHNDFLNLPD